MLPLITEMVRDYIQREIDTLTEYLEEFESAGGKNKRSLKEVQRAIKKLKARLDDTNQQIKRVSAGTITWDELGIDALYIDEFHCFKTSTARQIGLDHFDAWVRQFAETTQSLEMTQDGASFQMRSRFNCFTNIPELSKLWQQVLDVKPASELNLPRPKQKCGRPEIISVPANNELKEYVRELARRVEAIKSRRVSPHKDNMLKVTSDGRKAALDIRLVKPDAPRPAQSKVMAIVKNIARLYHETQDTRGVQLCFIDLGTPKAKK